MEIPLSCRSYVGPSHHKDETYDGRSLSRRIGGHHLSRRTDRDGGQDAEALAVAGGVIIAVGSDAAVMKTRGPKTEVKDLEGKTLVPGFVEPHTHVIGTAVNSLYVVPLSRSRSPCDRARFRRRSKH